MNEYFQVAMRSGKMQSECGGPAPSGKFDKEAVMKAMSAAKIESPRGSFNLSAANNPVQDIYLRRAEGKQNTIVEIAVPKLADPARGCRMN